jgi:hypothetical protein
MVVHPVHPLYSQLPHQPHQFMSAGNYHMGFLPRHLLWVTSVITLLMCFITNTTPYTYLKNKKSQKIKKYFFQSIIIINPYTLYLLKNEKITKNKKNRDWKKSSPH